MLVLIVKHAQSIQTVVKKMLILLTGFIYLFILTWVSDLFACSRVLDRVCQPYGVRWRSFLQHNNLILHDETWFYEIKLDSLKRKLDFCKTQTWFFETQTWFLQSANFILWNTNLISAKRKLDSFKTQTWYLKKKQTWFFITQTRFPETANLFLENALVCFNVTAIFKRSRNRQIGSGERGTGNL